MKTSPGRRIAASLFALLVATAAASARAEDIDIFGRPPSANDLPNVLMIWDSSANWSANIPVPNCYFWDDGVPTTDGPKFTAPNKEQGTKFAIEKCAIYNVIAALPTKADGSALYNVGLMLYNDSAKGLQGSYPRQQFLSPCPVWAALNSSSRSSRNSCSAGVGTPRVIT